MILDDIASGGLLSWEVEIEVEDTAAAAAVSIFCLKTTEPSFPERSQDRINPFYFPTHKTERKINISLITVCIVYGIKYISYTIMVYE